jgi:ubiquinone biosynthesis protein Coq4
MNIFAKAKAARSILRLVNDPRRIDEIFVLADTVMDDAVLDQMIANISRHEQGRSALEERPRLGRVDLAALRAMPEDSLGAAYAKHLDAYGLDPSTLPVRDTPTTRSYVLPHIYETHDVWHTVTGFGADVAGELGLQAFYSAQGPSKGPVAILTAGFVNTLTNGMSDKDARLEAIARGWLMGRRGKPLFGVRWGELWAVPLEEIRARFHIEPIAR